MIYLGLTVLALFLFLYMITASIDFGAGLIHSYATMTQQEKVLSGVIYRYLSPIWEVTNVFLVTFYIGVVGFFPKIANDLGSALLIAGSAALILLCLRGAYYAIASYSNYKGRALTYVHGVAGWLIPAGLSTVLVVSEGGFLTNITGKNGLGPDLDYAKLLTTPLTFNVILIALTSVVYISSLFLAWYGSKGKETKAVEVFRKYALNWAIPNILLSIAFLFTLKMHNVEHYNGMVGLWWLLAISLICFCGTFYLLTEKKSYGLAFVLQIAQFATAFAAYWISHAPYIIYPYFDMHKNFAGSAMVNVLVVSFVLGLFILVPSFYLLLKLFIFDKSYVEGKKSTKV